MRRLTLALVAVLALAVPASAHAIPTATNVRLGEHYTHVRAVVDFPTGGLTWWRYVVRDDYAWDGRAVYWIKCALLKDYVTYSMVRSAYGLTVRIRREDDRGAGCPFLRVELTSAPGTFVRTTYDSITGNRFVVDSWRP